MAVDAGFVDKAAFHSVYDPIRIRSAVELPVFVDDDGKAHLNVFTAQGWWLFIEERTGESTAKYGCSYVPFAKMEKVLLLLKDGAEGKMVSGKYKAALEGMALSLWITGPLFNNPMIKGRSLCENESPEAPVIKSAIDSLFAVIRLAAEAGGEVEVDQVEGKSRRA